MQKYTLEDFLELSTDIYKTKEELIKDYEKFLEDKNYFTVIIKKFDRYIHGLLYRIVGPQLHNSVFTIDDIKQEIYLKIYEIYNSKIDKNKLTQSYIFTWVYQIILNTIMNYKSIIKLPTYLLLEFRKIEKKGIDENNILQYKNVLSTMSLQGKVMDNEKRTLEDVIQGGNIQESITMKKINEFFKNVLTKKEYEIIEKRFGLNGKKMYTLEEIGDMYGISRERVRQIELNAINKLRDNIDVIFTFLGKEYNEKIEEIINSISKKKKFTRRKKKKINIVF